MGKPMPHQHREPALLTHVVAAATSNLVMATTIMIAMDKMDDEVRTSAAQEVATSIVQAIVLRLRHTGAAFAEETITTTLVERETLIGVVALDLLHMDVEMAVDIETEAQVLGHGNCQLRPDLTCPDVALKMCLTCSS